MQFDDRFLAKDRKLSLCTIGSNSKIPPKFSVAKKFVKCTDYAYACNNLTYFVNKAWAVPGTKVKIPPKFQSHKNSWNALIIQYACNSLTYFVNKGRAVTGNGSAGRYPWKINRARNWTISGDFLRLGTTVPLLEASSYEVTCNFKTNVET